MAVARVRVVPADIEFDVEPGETVMAAALRCGYYWPTVCGGQGTCRTCWLSVLEGAEELSPVGAWEQEGLNQLGPSVLRREQAVRLACQARPHGSVVAKKIGVRLARRKEDSA